MMLIDRHTSMFLIGMQDPQDVLIYIYSMLYDYTSLI